MWHVLIMWCEHINNICIVYFVGDALIHCRKQSELAFDWSDYYRHNTASQNSASCELCEEPSNLGKQLSQATEARRKARRNNGCISSGSLHTFDCRTLHSTQAGQCTQCTLHRAQISAQCTMHTALGCITPHTSYTALSWEQWQCTMYCTVHISQHTGWPVHSCTLHTLLSDGSSGPQWVPRLDLEAAAIRCERGVTKSRRQHWHNALCQFYIELSP